MVHVNADGLYGCYIGQLDKDNQFCGRGALISWDGRLLFQGQFKNGMKNGRGRKMKLSLS
jgi:hypothetical protein